MPKSAPFDYTQGKRGFTLVRSARVNTLGFTLVELLVVITIIAILSVIGITIFTGVQKSARDAKRRADIDAMSKALEVNKGQCTPPVGDKYCSLETKFFSSSAVPRDPKDNTKRYIENQTIGDPAYEGRSGTEYKFCADLETVRPTGITVDWDGTQPDYCRSNQQ